MWMQLQCISALWLHPAPMPYSPLLRNGLNRGSCVPRARQRRRRIISMCLACTNAPSSSSAMGSDSNVTMCHVGVLQAPSPAHVGAMHNGGAGCSDRAAQARRRPPGAAVAAVHRSAATEGGHDGAQHCPCGSAPPLDGLPRRRQPRTPRRRMRSTARQRHSWWRRASTSPRLRSDSAMP